MTTNYPTTHTSIATQIKPSGRTISCSNDIITDTRSYTLFWLEKDVNVSQDKLETQKKLQHLINNFHAFDDCDIGVDYLTDITDHKIILIISRSYAHRIVPLVHDFQQLIAIYIHCTDISAKTQWSLQYEKIKGLYADMEQLSRQLKLDQHVRKYADADPLVVNIYSTQKYDRLTEERDSKNASFMYFQVLISVLLKMASDQNSTAKQYLFQHFKHIYHGNIAEQRVIEEFERDYYPDKAIWWYTRPTFLYSTLNKALRESDYEVLLALRFFINDIYAQLTEEHIKCLQSYTNSSSILSVYRGQAIAVKELNFIRDNIGQYLSMQSFLSTSVDREIAHFFAQASAKPTDHTTRILFQFNIDVRLSNTKPYANIRPLSYFHDEEEVLIMLGAIFKIEATEYSCHEHLWICTLSLCNEDDYELRDLMAELKEAVGTEIPSLGFLLYKKGNYEKAQEYFYQLLLDETLSDHDKANCYGGLGHIALECKHYDEALINYQNEVSLWKKLGEQVYISNAQRAIGEIYYFKGHLDVALEYEQNALDIFFPLNHSQLGNVYSTMANIYRDKQNFNSSLEHYEKALKIDQQYLPANHENFGIRYTNMGITYAKKGDHKQALDSFQKAREILIKSLPSTHPNILSLERNINLMKRLLDIIEFAHADEDSFLKWAKDQTEFELNK